RPGRFGEGTVVVGGTQVPEADGTVFAGRGNLPAVAPYRDCDHLLHVPLEGSHRLAGRDLPDANGEVLAAGDEELAVGRDREIGDHPGMTLEGAEAGGDVGRGATVGVRSGSEPGLAVLAACEDRTVV